MKVLQRPRQPTSSPTVQGATALQHHVEEEANLDDRKVDPGLPMKGRETFLDAEVNLHQANCFSLQIEKRTMSSDAGKGW